MATKTHVVANRYRINSEQLRYEIEVDKEHVGTAMALAQALEDADETLDTIELYDGVFGSRQVCVRTGKLSDGTETAVPEAVHKQLSEWGYTHVGETSEEPKPNYNHTDECHSHVYK